MIKPLLSIIVPTRNRYEYLKNLLYSLCQNFNIDLIEIIITDNSYPKEDLTPHLAKFKNIKFYYIDKPISQVENFEFALEKTSGKYVTMIGDDDGISKKIIDLVLLMEKRGIEALHTPFVSYYWPGVTSKNKLNNFSGKIFVNDYSFKLTKIDLKFEILKCLRLGGSSLCNLPRLYYGIIRKETLQKVKSKTGFFFPGPSPDMANALSAALLIENAYIYDAPIFIAGNSPNSAAGLGLAGKHIGEISENPFLPKNYHLIWTDFVPRYWSGKTIWAETAIQVIFKTKMIDIALFNYYRLFASCLIYYPSHRVNTIKAINLYIEKRNHFFEYSKITIEFFKEWYLRFLSLLQNQKNRFSPKKGRIHSNIDNIHDAIQIIEVFNFKIND